MTRAALTSVVLLVLIVPAAAHHGGGTFDGSREVKLSDTSFDAARRHERAQAQEQVAERYWRRKLTVTSMVNVSGLPLRRPGL